MNRGTAAEIGEWLNCCTRVTVGKCLSESVRERAPTDDRDRFASQAMSRTA
jgi:hypothetical protein